MKITISDDGATVARRSGAIGDGQFRYGIVAIGSIDFMIGGFNNEAAARARVIAAEFERVALDVLALPIPAAAGQDLTEPPPPGEAGQELAGAAASEALGRHVHPGTVRVYGSEADPRKGTGPCGDKLAPVDDGSAFGEGLSDLMKNTGGKA